MKKQTTYYSTPGMEPTTILVPETEEEIAAAVEAKTLQAKADSERRQKEWEAGQPARDAKEMAVDITDPRLWADAINMACGEGVMGLIVRDRMLDYFDDLQAK